MRVSNTVRASIAIILFGTLHIAHANMVEPEHGLPYVTVGKDLVQAKFNNVRDGYNDVAVNGSAYMPALLANDVKIKSNRFYSDFCRAEEVCEGWQRPMLHYVDEHEQGNEYVLSSLGAAHEYHWQHDDDSWRHHGEDRDMHTYVPIPAVSWLFSSGLILLGLIATRSRKSMAGSLRLAM